LSFELRINDVLFVVDSLDDMRADLARLQETQFAEVWLVPAQEWPTLGALVHGQGAWLTYIRHEGDAGFSTRNPNYEGPQEATLQFYLSNGQCDEYPASWSVTTAEAVRAMEYFFASLQRAPWLTWHED
jgi:hypothetical protein